jgi:RNA 2',3'-cyclic 3'-phosphodiesterase
MLPPTPRRLFIGLLPGREVQARIARHAAQWHWPLEARRTRFGRYHLTLQFLGDDVRLATEHRLRAALREVPMEPLQLVLATPMRWKQGIAVLLPDAHDGLFALRERIAAGLARAGLRQPRLAFTPHVTLARYAYGAMPPHGAPPIACDVGEFVLVWSRLDTRPAEYVVLEHYGATPGWTPPAATGRRGPQGELFGDRDRP